MNKYRKLVSNTAILAVGQFSSKFLVIIMMKFYTETLSPDGYGTVGIFIDVCTILMTVVTLSIGDALIRFGIDKNYDNSQVFSIGLYTVIVGLLVFAPLSPLLRFITFKGGEMPFKGYTVWLYFYIASGSIKSCCALFARSAGAVKLYAIDGVFTTVVNILLNLMFMMGFGWGIKGYLLSVILADAASTAFIFYNADLKRYLRFHKLQRGLRNSMYRYSIPMIFTAVMWMVIGTSDSLFITWFSGLAATGLYKAAYRFPNIIVTMSLIFSQAWNMEAIAERNSREVSLYYTNVFGFLQSIVYIMSAGLLLIIRPTMAIMTAIAFHGAYRYSAMLIMAVVFSCFSSFAGSVYIASRKSVRSMATATLGAGTNILFNFIMIPLWGIHGAAAATFLSYIVIFIVRAIDARKIVVMNFRLRKIIFNSVLLMIMSAVVMFVKDTSVYYPVLSVLFIVVTAVNFKSMIDAVKSAFNKKSK